VFLYAAEILFDAAKISKPRFLDFGSGLKCRTQKKTTSKLMMKLGKKLKDLTLLQKATGRINVIRPGNFW
jgi:hypothetical protein